MMRLDKMLSNLGYGSRKEVKLLIRKGHVQVNKTTIKKDDFRLDPEIDQVTVHEQPVIYKPLVYLMMNKPQGVISATKDASMKTVVDLVKGYEHYQIFPVGRLDKDTEGLLLLTNDGILARELLFPDKNAYKKYYVQLAYPGKAEDIEKFASGLTISHDEKCRPARLIYLSEKEAYVYLTEGKFHQVKRMFAAIDNRVVYLKRLEMKGLVLDPQLAPGEYRELSKEEMEILNIRKLHEKC